jgi:NAD(P)-dependent dehydrogenase (short-subunit alcohol dehydrogenase family)
MDLKLARKVVLITGSSRDIGLATAKAFAAEGCRLMLSAGIVKLSGSDKVPRSVAGSSGPKGANACLSSCLHQGGQA